MIKYVNDVPVELTPEEIEQGQNEAKEHIYQEHVRPRSEMEGLLALGKSLVKSQLSLSEDKTLGIQCMALFDYWAKGDYNVGDVRTDPKTGYPYECITEHNSITNPDWTIDNRTLWKPWHSTSLDYALPFEQPTGAHDMYKVGEYMVYTDKIIYECIENTNFSPTDYPQAWKAH